jgi:hypothetical protein
MLAMELPTQVYGYVSKSTVKMKEGVKMTNIKPEQLKALAERMGYEVFGVEVKRRVIVWDGENIHTRQKYNPLTNDSQMKELMEMLLQNEWQFDCTSEGNYRAFNYGMPQPVWLHKGKTINETVTLAAIAMEEGK